MEQSLGEADADDPESTRVAVVLRSRLADLSSQRDALVSELEGIRLAKGDTSADDEHDPEGSTLSSDWSRISGLMAAIESQAAEAAAALSRVDAGTYGVCTDCGLPIAPARLEARPGAALCIHCAS